MGADPTTGPRPHTELDYLLMAPLLISIIQAICLVTIIVCAWLMLDRPGFALVAASLVLATTIYEEWRMDD